MRCALAALVRVDPADWFSAGLQEYCLLRLQEQGCVGCWRCIKAHVCLRGACKPT